MLTGDSRIGSGGGVGRRVTWCRRAPRLDRFWCQGVLHPEWVPWAEVAGDGMILCRENTDTLRLRVAGRCKEKLLLCLARMLFRAQPVPFSSGVMR